MADVATFRILYTIRTFSLLLPERKELAMSSRSFEDMTRKDWVIAISATMIVALAYGIVLFRYPLVYGIDSPYYLIQVRSILRTGMISYPDPPLSFYFFALLTMIIGDSMVAVKLGTVLFCALTVIPSYLIGKRISGSTPAAIASVVAASLSAGLMVMSGQLLKNTLGVFFLMSFIYLCLRILEGDESKTTKGMAIATFTLTALTHILDLGLALLYLMLLSIASLVMGSTRRKFLHFSVPFLVGCVMIGGLAYFVYAGYTTDIGKGLIFLQQFVENLENNDVSILAVTVPSRAVSYLSAAMGVVGVAIYYRRKKPDEAAFMAISTMVIVLLNLPFVPDQFSMRFTLMSFVPMSSIVAGLAGLIGRKGFQWGAVVLFVPLFLLTQTIPVSRKLGPMISPEEYNDLLEMANLIPEGSKVIGGKPGAGYWVLYLLDSEQFKPSPGEIIDYPLYFVSGPGWRPAPRNAISIYSGNALHMYVIPPARR